MSINSKFTSKQLEEEIYDLFAKYSVPVQSATGQELNVYCPFHKNVHSAAMYINVKTGLWQCFNPSCGKGGRFSSLTKMLGGKEQALRDDTTYDDIINAWDEPERGGISVNNIKINYEDSQELE